MQEAGRPDGGGVGVALAVRVQNEAQRFAERHLALAGLRVFSLTAVLGARRGSIHSLGRSCRAAARAGVAGGALEVGELALLISVEVGVRLPAVQRRGANGPCARRDEGRA